jgi:hypothetical protein
MGLREDIAKKIDKKQQEIRALQEQLRDCTLYIETLQEVIKMIPRQAEEGKEISLRPGSQLAKARDAIKAAGKPLHITEILQAIGRGNSKENRLALSSSISAYVRKGEIFTRPEPNTFGLDALDSDFAELMEALDEDSIGTQKEGV